MNKKCKITGHFMILRTVYPNLLCSEELSLLNKFLVDPLEVLTNFHGPPITNNELSSIFLSILMTCVSNIVKNM